VHCGSYRPVGPPVAWPLADHDRHLLHHLRSASHGDLGNGAPTQPRRAAVDTRRVQLEASVVGRVIGGKYRVEQVIGQGGCGLVVRAVHRGLGQTFAIKLLKPALADRDDVARRFVREAQALATLASEHTVRAFDVGVEPEVGPYFVMEWLDGVTMAQALATGPVDVPTAVDYALQICVALAEAHCAGLIHRDIKPSNLFLTRRTDGRALVKVMDFGIAKWTGAGGALTAPAVMLGSPGYLAPEQARDARSVDARADIWAIGAVFHELICGQPLRGGVPGADAGAHRLLGHAMPLPAWVPPALRATIDRCLAPDRAARYPHVAALAADLAVFAPPTAAALAPEITRIASSPRAAARGRVDFAPTINLVRPRPAAPPSRSHPRRRVALGGIALTAMVVALIVVIATQPTSRERSLGAAWPTAPIHTPLPVIVTPLAAPPPAPSQTIVPTPPLAPAVAALGPAPTAPSRPRARVPRRDEPTPQQAPATPPGVPGDVDGDGIPDVR
jgi:serine/threonine protein kinase